MIASITIYANFKQQSDQPPAQSLDLLEDVVVPELRGLKERLEAKGIKVTFTGTQSITYGSEEGEG